MTRQSRVELFVYCLLFKLLFVSLSFLFLLSVLAVIPSIPLPNWVTLIILAPTIPLIVFVHNRIWLPYKFHAVVPRLRMLTIAQRARRKLNGRAKFLWECRPEFVDKYPITMVFGYLIAVSSALLYFYEFLNTYVILYYFVGATFTLGLFHACLRAWDIHYERNIKRIGRNIKEEFLANRERRLSPKQEPKYREYEPPPMRQITYPSDLVIASHVDVHQYIVDRVLKYCPYQLIADVIADHLEPQLVAIVPSTFQMSPQHEPTYKKAQFDAWLGLLDKSVDAVCEQVPTIGVGILIPGVRPFKFDRFERRVRRAANEYNEGRAPAFGWYVLDKQTPIYPNHQWFRALTDFRFPVVIPDELRFEHSWCVAPSGSGKSTALSYLINRDMDKVADGKASVVVMESNRDLINGISKLKRFAPGGDLHGRLIYIDVEDVEHPLALNLFDFGSPNIVSPRDREALHNKAVAMLDYVFRALLGTELTSRQTTLLNFSIQLLISIPGATLDTMLDLFDKGGAQKFRKEIAELDPDSQRFFATQFDNDEQMKRTKQEVAARIFAIKRIPSIARMFSSPRTFFDFYEELGKGRVILINASRDLLQADGTEIFGRFMLALLLMAAERRTLLPKEDRLDTFIYIDEAHDIVAKDEKIPVFLDQARRCRVALTLAHQRLDQMSPPVLNALYGGTAIKIMSRLSDANASAMARNMNTTAEFILNQPTHAFAVFARGTTDTAVSVQFPFVDFAKEPAMTAAEQRAIRDDMRRRFSIGVKPPLPPSPPSPESDDPTAPTHN